MCAKRKVAISFISTIAIIMLTSPLVAQVSQTTISGAVRDATGSMLPTKDANPEVRQQLVHAIAKAHPDFITFGGDIALNCDNASDWNEYDRETAVWSEHRIPVYPALGNHDLHGDVSVALGNYFARFPILQQNRFYAVHTSNTVMLTLDSALDELTGPQGQWLQYQLAHLPSGIDFVFIVLHHPPYTSSSDAKTYGGGHSARSPEQKLAAYIEKQ